MASQLRAVSWLYWLLLLHPFFVSTVYSGHHTGGHGRLHARTKSSNTLNSTSEADELVKKALAALATQNVARMKYPNFNKNEFNYEVSQSEPAPPLQYKDDETTLLRRGDDTATTSAASYSIPTELAQAARVLAEANPPQPQGNHSDVSSSIRQKYSRAGNTTNTPMPLTAPDGLLGNWAVRAESNGSALAKRASSYWMADLPQRGYSPYASDDYKVC